MLIKRKKVEPRKPAPVIAMVALGDHSLPEPGVIARACAARVQDCEVALADEGRDGTVMLRAGEDSIAISLMPVAIPWSDLEGPCATAWWWPEATETMRNHKAHLIVALLSDIEDPKRHHIRLSQAIAGLVDCCEAVGIYWGAGTVVHEPARFSEESETLSREYVEPMLWVDHRVEPNADGLWRLFTTGMSAFNQLEIEIDWSTAGPETVFELGQALSYYLILTNATIKDGNTFGRSEDEKFTVRHCPSMWDREGDVLKLELP